MRPLRRTGVGVLTGAAVVVGIVLVLQGHAGTSTSAPARTQRSTSTGEVTPQHAIARIQVAFVTGYLAYLDGAGTVGALPFASITAREQATRAGRIPAAFRDGPLRVTRTSGARTDYSAQATITTANRSESYVLTVQLLLTQHGWRVAQLTTPDLAMDDNTRPVLAPAVPPSARLASRLFTVAYADYRTTRSAPLPAGMTATAEQELTDGEDPLAGAARSARHPRLLALRFGPFQGTEFAVTATIQTGRRQQFTVLMVNHAGRWECDAFL